MFSFGNSAGSTTAVPLGGNSLFQTPAASSSNQQQNQNQQSSFLTSTSNPTTTPSGAFNFGTSSGPSNSTFNFGGLNSNSNPLSSNSSSFNSTTGTLSNSTNPSTLVTSLATYPFQYIQQCFDSNHLNYRFRTFFYNVADDLTEAQRLDRQTQRPVNVSDALWAQVRNDNPDPARMIPVLANGFSDLHARARWEDDAIRAHTDKLTELHERTSRILRDLDVDLMAKIRTAQQRHQDLSLRLLKIMKGMEVLRRSGTKLSTAEVESLTKLKSYLAVLSNGPLENGALRASSFQLNSLLESGRLDAFKSARSIKLATDESLIAVHSLLNDQHVILKNTVEVLQKDYVDLQTIRAGYRPL